MQERLKAVGYFQSAIDGVYGPATAHAVSGLQRDRNLPVTGAVDDQTWSALMNRPIPTVFERALQLTAAFEGHGFGTVRGNWDGAWLTWGIVGFTLKHGALADILLAADCHDPNLIQDAFADRATPLREILHASRPEQQRWANSISDGMNVQEPWRSSFERLGSQPAVQSLQLERARSAYFVPALRTAALLNLITEQGLALAFDIHVQNGGIAPAARAAIHASNAAEPTRRVIIANAVADAAKPDYRDDIRARKLAIATGEGRVHQEYFVTANWGLADYWRISPDVHENVIHL
jgi:hypothetical protein